MPPTQPIPKSIPNDMATKVQAPLQKLQYKFIDLDDFISEKEGQTIQDIFKNKGEIYFRKQEHHYLKEIL